MNELRLGHRVLAWYDAPDNGKRPSRSNKVKGRFVSYEKSNSYPYLILPDNEDRPIRFEFCKLDLDAKEFLPGDEVEVRNNDNEPWKQRRFGHKTDGLYYSWSGKVYLQCRYRKPEQPDQ